MIARIASFQQKPFLRLRSRALSTTVLVSLLATPLAAQSTLDWDAGNGAPNAPLGGDGVWIEGGATNLWQNGPADNQPFVAGDTAVFGPSAGATPYTVTIDTDVNVADIIFDTNGVTIDGVGQVIVSGEVSVTTAGDAAEIAAQIASDALIGGAGDLSLSGGVDGGVTMQGTGTLSILSAIGSLTTTSGTVNIGTGAEVGAVTNTTGTVRITDGSVTGETVNDATLEMAGGTLGDVTNNGTAVIEGTQDVSGDFANNGTLDASGAGAETLNVGGSFEINSGSNITTDAAGDTVNTLTVQAGEIEINSNTAFNGGDDLDGSIVLQGNITNNADIDLTGDLTLTGTLTTTSTIEQSGALDAAGNDVEVNGGQYFMRAGGSLINGGRLVLDGGGDFTLDAGGSAVFDVVAILDSDSELVLNGGTFQAINGLSNEGGSVLTLNLGESITGAVSNSAQVTFNGGSIERLTNTADGTVDVNAGGSVDTTVTNAGTFNVNSGAFTYDTFTNQAGGALNVAAGTSMATTGTDTDVVTLENAAGGQATIAGTVSGFVANRIDGEMTLESTSNVQRITNNGDLDINGGQIGRLANTANGDLDVAGDTTVAQAVNNFGAFDITSGTLTAPNFLNNDGAEFGISDGATLDATLLNQSGGSVALDGTVTGLVTNRAGGTINVTGTGGQITAPGLAMMNEGTLTIQSGASLGATGGLDNMGGTLNLRAGRLHGDVTGGTINVRGAQAAIGGSLDLAGGSVDLTESGTGGTDTTLRIGGDAVLNGTLNYDLAFNADPNIDNAASDRIIVAGDVSGAPTFQFDVDGSARRLTGVEVLRYGSNSGLSLGELRGFEGITEFDYFLADNGSGVIGLQSRVNTGIASLAATVGLTENVVGTIINRPTSPYVTDLAVDPGDKKCGVGSWARATGGRADADGEFTDQVSGLSSSAPVELSYAGVQVGGDFACFGGVYNGWDLSFGGIFGYNQGESTNEVFAIDAQGNATDILNSVTETDISQKYAGAYLTAARGRLFGDVQLRFEVTDFESDNTEKREDRGIDLNNEKYQNRSRTLSGSVGYSWPLNEVGDFSFISLAGFQVSQSETDTIDLGSDGELSLEDKTSKLGFVSGTLAKTTIRPDNMGLLSYFGTATYYEDFSDSQEATLINGTSRNPFDLENLGSYGEVSAGINYVRILNPGQVGNARQFNAAVRVDARSGDSVDSWGITAQMRLQF